MTEWPDEQYSESEIHSFIIRIWLEETDVVSEHITWHGRLVYLANGEEHFFKDLMEIPRFIRARLGLKNMH